MSDLRKNMDQALKEIVIPVLREKGFKGTMPHFRREMDGYFDLISFQFSQYGGRFYVEIGKYSSKGIKHPNGDFIAPENVKNYQLGLSRKRLSPTTKEEGHFDFDQKSLFRNIFKKVANEVVFSIESQAEPWWANKKNIDKYSL